MKAAVFFGAGDMKVRELDLPQISDQELLVQVKACAVCGTDIRVFEGKKTQGISPPAVIGHEIAGGGRVRAGRSHRYHPGHSLPQLLLLLEWDGKYLRQSYRFRI
jgi:D-arabinose 1-dehydrogenase-like Zn-dependent alcohol dehydrogenase